MFEISVRHCLDAVHKVSQLGWLDVETFDLAAYEHFEAVDNGGPAPARANRKRIALRADTSFCAQAT
jgi:hypothetical protein